MFQSILNFMQENDKNGEWLEAQKDEAPYILQTLKEWINEGLELTERVKGYIEYLESSGRL